MNYRTSLDPPAVQYKFSIRKNKEMMRQSKIQGLPTHTVLNSSRNMP